MSKSVLATLVEQLMILSLWFQVQVRLALGRNCAHKNQKGLKYLTQGSVQIQALRKILCQ